METQHERTPTRHTAEHKVASDLPFFSWLVISCAFFVLLLGGMLVADISYTSLAHLGQALNTPEIRFAIRLSLFSCTVTTGLSLLIGVPTAYLLSRYRFPGIALIDMLVHIPLALPPLVIGLSLLILFQTACGLWVQRFIPFTYAVPGVVLAQFPVACALVIRTMRVSFGQLSSRQEDVALTLGSTRFQAFWHVVFPEALPGVLAAATLAWARALGEFGPVLIFAGATRMRTEVLPTTVFLELSVGRIEAALAVSLLMVMLAILVLSATRLSALLWQKIGGTAL